MASQAGPPLGTRQAEALIDLGAIAANLRGHLSRTCAPVMAVVSADACGHGAAQVARTALDHGASWLGVSFAAEAPALRGNGNSAPILALLPTPDEELVSVLSADVDVSVSSTEQLEAIADCAARLGRRAEIHLKADTGLHHDGATAEEWPQAEAAGLTHRLRHLGGSAAARRVPQLHYGMVRIGSGLYGVGAAAHAETEADKGLIPAMSLRSRIVATRRVPAGEGVSFGHLYTTLQETMLGLVPLGFADELEILARVSPRLPRSHVPAPDTLRSEIPAQPVEIRVQTAVGHG